MQLPAWSVALLCWYFILPLARLAVKSKLKMQFLCRSSGQGLLEMSLPCSCLWCLACSTRSAALTLALKSCSLLSVALAFCFKNFFHSDFQWMWLCSCVALSSSVSFSSSYFYLSLCVLSFTPAETKLPLWREPNTLNNCTSECETVNSF